MLPRAMGILFRAAQAADAARLVSLAAELGYPTTNAELEVRLARLLAEPGHVVFVAEEAGELLGWIHAQEFHSLASPPAGLVTGLVVTAARRRGGLGRGLLEAVEGWARARSLDVLRLRVNKKRRGARAFYERLGFQRTKEQLQYTKLLSSTVARRSRRASARGRASSRV